MTRHLYIHIPFCNHICAFCDFRRVATNDRQMMETFVEMVLASVRQTGHPHQYTTIYLGGGTPNHLPNDLLEHLLTNLRPYLARHYEWTIECNPELVTPEQIAVFQRVGLNRVSLGVQSVNNKILRDMRRYHTIEDAERAIRLIQDAHLNLSLDFIYDLPNSTVADIDGAVDFLVRHNIQHVSYYALEIKPHALLRNHHIDELVEEEQMVHLHQRLADAGFHRYEISNWSRTKRAESKHNRAYWETRPWQAIGYGAHGFEHGQIYKFGGKILHWQVEQETVNVDEQVLMMGLRLIDGIDLSLARNRRAYARYREQMGDDVVVVDNHLRAKNPDLLDDILIKII